VALRPVVLLAAALRPAALAAVRLAGALRLAALPGVFRLAGALRTVPFGVFRLAGALRPAALAAVRLAGALRLAALFGVRRLAGALRAVAALLAGLFLAPLFAGRAARLRAGAPVPPSCARRFFSLISSTLSSESCLSMLVPGPDAADWEHSGQRARLPSYFIVSRVTALPHSEHDVTYSSAIGFRPRA